ncbi:MAG TPA: acyltransferase [Tepidisphaeraceae bacterium]|jgi:peptidoglycan/LPS O-acetylase OafA/YrhL|nr:acyltransferase [Tepidisphaeraceae bacterium]
MPKEIASHKNNNLDFLRLLFAVVVVFSHSYPLTQGEKYQRERLWLATGGLFSFGTVAVAFFFIASGFLITASLLKSPTRVEYVRRRCLRILPGYGAALIISICAVAPFATAAGSRVWRQFLAQAVSFDPLSARDVFPSNPLPGVLNGSLWTVRYEIGCYFVLLLLGAAGFLRRPGCAVALLFCSFLIGPLIRWQPVLAANVPLIGDIKWWGLFLPYFLAGAVAYLWKDSIPLRLWMFIAACIACAAAVGTKNPGLVYPTAAVCGAYFVLYLGFNARLPFHNFGRFGDFSYGTYLYAFPIQQLIVMARPGISPLILFVLAAPLAVLAGVASWYGVERHFIRRKPTSRVTDGPVFTDAAFNHDTFAPTATSSLRVARAAVDLY